MREGYVGLYEPVTEERFVERLLEDPHGHWSISGAKALYAHLTSVCEDCGVAAEFDRVALRCEYTEVWAEEDLAEYGGRVQLDDFDSFDDYRDAVLEAVREETDVIEFEKPSYGRAWIVREP